MEVREEHWCSHKISQGEERPDGLVHRAWLVSCKEPKLNFQPFILIPKATAQGPAQDEEKKVTKGRNAHTLNTKKLAASIENPI